MSLIPKKGTVYVVDDDEAVRDSLQWLLEGKDYRVKCFDSAESFLSRFDPREVACLIADIRMDGMSGLELQDRLLERRSSNRSCNSRPLMPSMRMSAIRQATSRGSKRDRKDSAESKHFTR